MKILYVITGLGQGGAERVVCDLADGMARVGYEVKIAYLTGEVLTHPANKNIELINIKLNNLSSLPKAYLKLSRIIRSYQPDVVHSHMVHANIIMRTVRVITPINRLISTAHNSNEGGKLRMFAYRATHYLANTSTNVSQEAVAAFENMKAVPIDGMKTVYNGIDLNKFKYDPDAKLELAKELNISNKYKIILATGRFSEQKDYPNLLNAAYLLKKESDFDFKLIIVGDGELRSLIEDTIDKLDIKDNVVLLGRRSDIPRLMSAADLFVLSSKYEGFGLVVAEAMACECLVVATDCGGVAEVLNNSEFLVSPNNPTLLKEKIFYSLGLEGDKKSSIIYKNLKRIQERFCLKDIIKKWIIIYNEE